MVKVIVGENNRLSSLGTITVTDVDSLKISGVNREIYQRLKQALGLNLRRQIFVAVCDDLALRDHLAAHLVAELGISETIESETAIPSSQFSVPSPHFISLELELNDPNPWRLIGQWLTRHQPTGCRGTPGFQILGVERLTRQPAPIQWSFLRYLRDINQGFAILESSLLLWIPKPWLCSIERSAPEFWQWRTGVFEFEGDPTLAPATPEESESEGPKGSGSAGVTESSSCLQIPSPAPHSPSLPTLQLIEQLQRQQASPEAITVAYQSLGNFYRDRVLAGEASHHNLMMAIRAYEQVLELGLGTGKDERKTVPHAAASLSPSTPTSLSPHSPTPDLLNDLGTLYWMLSRHFQATPDAASQALSVLERSLIVYQMALSQIDSDSLPQVYARLQKNLGAAYGDLARYRDAAENLQHSILAYQKSLLYLSVETEPQQYIAIQNNLGAAYWNLAQHSQPIPHLKAAITAYSQALRYYPPDHEPLHYAMLQNNLGTAYWNLAQYEPSESLLRSAIDAYHAALKYRTPDTAPSSYAATQNNLGTAYWHLANQSLDQPTARIECLQQAIQAYQGALAISQKLTPNLLTFDILATHNNLGLAYSQLATESQYPLELGEKMTHLQAALHHHLQAWAGYQQQPAMPPEESASRPSTQSINEAKNQKQEVVMGYIIKTIRAFYRECGLPGQNLALSKVPGHLLPEILRRL